jgi:hypothetical protein
MDFLHSLLCQIYLCFSPLLQPADVAKLTNALTKIMETLRSIFLLKLTEYRNFRSFSHLS